MLTWDRKYKDVYFLYKANWNPEPMVYIATRDWMHRAGYDDTQYNVDVYANTPDVTFFVNGNKIKTAIPDDIHKCTFTIGLKDGDNFIEAVGKDGKKLIKDAVVIQNKTYPHNLSNSKSFSSVYINVGANTQYTDDDKMVWLQDQPYAKGSYGYLSGIPTNMSLRNVIKNTSHTPLMYSYLDSVTNYRVDVPDGIYEVTLFFIEPEKIEKGKRVFDVSINNNTVIDKLDLAAEAGYCTAVNKSFVIKVMNGNGLAIALKAIKGSAVLSGIQIVKQ
jgi:beta-galactosidase